MATVALAAGTPASAAVFLDQNVTNDVIFGSGNANGSFTVDRGNGIELGLRGKLRFNSSNLPENTFNSNGDGTYSFAAGLPPTGFGFAPGSPTTPIWNFEWSINSNFDGSGTNLDALTYQIGIDFDAGVGTNFLIFDPVITAGPGFADNAYGDNSTGNGAGTVPTTLTEAQTLANTKNLAQNSWNMEFFNNAPFDIFDPTVDGTYDFFIAAFDLTGLQLARVDIAIIAGAGATKVVEPATMGLFLIGLIGLGGLARRRNAA